MQIAIHSAEPLNDFISKHLFSWTNVVVEHSQTITGHRDSCQYHSALALSHVYECSLVFRWLETMVE